MTDHYIDGQSKWDYLALDALSSSRLKLALSSIEHFQANQQASASRSALDMGTAVHSLLLTPGQMHDEVAVAPEEATTRNTKAWRTWVENQDQRKALLLAHELETANCIAAAVRADPTAGLILSRAAGFERTVLWSEGDLPAKGRVDWWIDTPEGAVLVDLKKTTNPLPEADPSGAPPFQATVTRLRYHLQLAWYSRGWTRAVGPVAGAMLVAVSASEPWIVRTYSMGHWLEIGNRLVEQALNRIRQPDIDSGIQILPIPRWADALD